MKGTDNSEIYKIDLSTPVSVYFVGIGGVSMSGLAEILADAGFTVSGSDRARSTVCDHLESLGIKVFYGQRASNITDDLDVAVLTAAISETNPEYAALKEKKIPMISRAELLGQLMQNYKLPIAVSGTHGKTTTTSMVSEILLQADRNPTLHIGGMYKSINGNTRVGGKDYLVLEACEYTNSFLSFFPKISIILNIEEDHLDFFKDLQDIRNSFHRFAQILPADGCLVINSEIENPEELTADLPCKVVTYCGNGKNTPSADYYAKDITFNEKGCALFTACAPGKPDRQIALQVPGLHNVGNALAALAVADLLSVEDAVSANALHDFGGTGRRFEYKGTIGGVTVIDDYAHHPTEIRATLTAARAAQQKSVWCVFQPHTYTRTKAFLKDFASALSLADHVVLADIYAARETDNLGINSATLQKEILALGKECSYFPTFDEIENFLLENCTKGDMLITMGAGDVYKIGDFLLGK